MKDTFIEITATFVMVNPRTNHHIVATVERSESGASAYGDQSCHKVQLVDSDTKTYYDDELFDTRYDWISTKKSEWTKFWKDFFVERGYKEVNLETFTTKEVAYAERIGVRLKMKGE